MILARRAAGITLAVMSVLAVPAPRAQGQTYYEYWGYWHKPPGASSWHYSTVGGSGYHLQSGTQVEGWRFAVGTASPSDPQPRPSSVSYDAYCGGKNTDKTYRVLLVVDYGTSSSAPAGPVYSCYGFDSSVSGFTVLTQQHSERDSGGLICAIDTYPRSGCGNTVSSPAPGKPRPRPTATTAAPASARPATRPPAAQPPAAQPPATGPHTSASAGTVATAAPPGRPAASATTAATTPSRGASVPLPSPSVSLRPFTGAASTSRSATPLGLVVGIAAAVALGLGATWMWRRPR